jgi:hypothetical protein
MFETTKVLIKNNTRNIMKKIKEAPVLYIFFILMMVFSILIFGFTTFFLINYETELDLSLNDIFFLVLFSFFFKSAYDFYNHFVKAENVTYALATDVDQKKTIFEIFFGIFVINLLIWFAFSGMFIISLMIFNVDITFPLEYLIFTIGVIVSICLGCSICINFFSPERYRLIPNLILIGFFWLSKDPFFVTLTLPLAVLHVFWSIKNGVFSYQFIRRKKRVKERTQIKNRNVISALFHREITVIWRDNLMYSFVFSSCVTGFGAGYLFLYGDRLFIPESLIELYGGFLPSMFVFMGVFVVIVYTGVFPALNLFLNEERTMWIIRHIPLKSETIVFGKTSALALCFVTSIPFIPYISIFIGFDKIVFMIWFLVFSYLAGIIISIPLGVKYVGKKSDIMLLYSIAMILFAVLGSAAMLGLYIENQFQYPILFYFLILIAEIIVLYISLKISSSILTVKYPLRLL